MDNGASSYRRFRDEGDESGLVEIILKYRNGLTFYLYSIVGDIHAAEDLCEDVFVLLGTKKPRDKGTASFKTWLYTIGRNRALNYLKKKKTATVSFDELQDFMDEADSPEQRYLRAEDHAQLYQAFSKLKPEYQHILWLVYYEKFSLKESAVILKKSVHSTEMLVSRARKSLKCQLEKEDFHYEKL